jgi:IMP dehydrogenase
MKTAYTFDDIQIIPKYSEVQSRSECSLVTRFTKNRNIVTPYVSSPMDTVTGYEMASFMMKYGGVGILHRFMTIEEQAQEVSRIKLDRINHGMVYSQPEAIVCAAIGATGDYQERAKELALAGSTVILIDVAHGNTKQVKDAIQWCKQNLPDYVDIIAGNVATREGARNLAEWGADAIRVGIGNGSLCETRIRTGIGVPQVTALLECVKGVEESGIDVPVMADGGMKTPGDIAKALSLGADTVMVGSLLSGTRESPGEIQKVGMWPNEQLFKKYRGSASAETKKAHGMEEKNVEGNTKLIPYKGKASRILDDLSDGLRSSMSYVNATDLVSFRANSEHVIITQNGLIEAKPHLLL